MTAAAGTVPSLADQAGVADLPQDVVGRREQGLVLHPSQQINDEPRPGRDGDARDDVPIHLVEVPGLTHGDTQAGRGVAGAVPRDQDLDGRRVEPRPPDAEEPGGGATTCHRRGPGGQARGQNVLREGPGGPSHSQDPEGSPLPRPGLEQMGNLVDGEPRGAGLAGGDQCVLAGGHRIRPLKVLQ